MGLIQPIYPYTEPVALVCNDEGILQELRFNRSVEGGYGGIFGTFFVCGLGEEYFCSLTPEQICRYKEKFRHAELLIGASGNEPITIRIRVIPKQASTAPEKHHEPER